MGKDDKKKEIEHGEFDHKTPVTHHSDVQTDEKDLPGRWQIRTKDGSGPGMEWLYGPKGVTCITDNPNQTPGGIDPKFLLMHYTAGPSMEGAIRSLTNPKRKASAHLIIDKNGDVTQLVPFNNKAWHAGRSVWQPEPSLRYEGLNRFSIGIELVNGGRLLKAAGDTYRTWWGKKIPLDDVFIDEDYYITSKYANQSIHKTGLAFERYPEEQLLAVLEICRTLVETFDMIDILGHSDVALPEGRKLDPGPAFPMENFQAALFGRDEDE